MRLKGWKRAPDTDPAKSRGAGTSARQRATALRGGGFSTPTPLTRCGSSPSWRRCRVRLGQEHLPGNHQCCGGCALADHFFASAPAVRHRLQSLPQPLQPCHPGCRPETIVQCTVDTLDINEATRPIRAGRRRQTDASGTQRELRRRPGGGAAETGARWTRSRPQRRPWRNSGR